MYVTMNARLVVLAALWGGLCQGEQGSNFYTHTVRAADGQDLDLSNYQGMVTLVVNVASLCGYTDSTYKALKRLHDILSYGGHFSVLAFPCNQFGDQEPHDIDEIVEFATSNYDVEFPIFDKISVIGEHADPAFRYLTDASSVVPDWNFYKYLVGAEGQVLGAWGTRTTIEEIFDEVQAAVETVRARAATPAPPKHIPNHDSVTPITPTTPMPTPDKDEL